MCCLFAFFYANKARISNFQNNTPLGRRGRGTRRSSAPTDTPWYAPYQVTNIHSVQLMYYKMDLETYDGIECKLNLTLCFKSI